MDLATVRGDLLADTIGLAVEQTEVSGILHEFRRHLFHGQHIDARRHSKPAEAPKE
jgi:hypothetical protein